MSSINEQAVVYAALILQDDNVEITAEKLNTIIKAAGIEIEPIWASIFAKALEGKNVGELLMNVGAGGSAPAAAGAAAAGGAAAEEAAAAPAEEEEEEDDDMGFGLFD
jgi:large subunit ribosomal protein LP1